MTIAPLTKWLYVGGEEGFDFVHTVVSVELQTDPKMPHVTSYSDVYQDDEDLDEGDYEQGFCWAGPLNLFLKSFKPLGNPDGSVA
jgi:hypothetical protein